jgi:deazaflavin-dependent oxidoreductase (nitroreductase family)
MTGGRALNWVNGLPVMLLTTTGRKTGNAHTVPLVYLRDGSNYVIAPGVLENPAWFLNLKANSQARVQIGRLSAQVEAAVADRNERHRLWVKVPPYWESYRKNAREELPLVILKVIEQSL